MLNYFNLHNWSGIDKTLEQKPNIFLSQFIIITIIACFIQVINDVIYVNFVTVLLDLIVVFIALLSLYLNERGKHLLAKLIFTLIGTTFIFVYAAISPKETGLYLVFFPILTITFLIFNNEQKHVKYGSIAFIILLLIILELTNYQPFGDIDITDKESVESSFYVNLGISIFIIVFSMYNIDIINNKIEQIRLEAEKELKLKNADLKQANDELDHFVYSASHDLKAPLSSILGLINIAKYEVKDDDIMDYFIRIENRVFRLTKFIKEVIEISRNTRTTVVKSEVNLNELVSEIIENNSFMETDKIKIENEIFIDDYFLLDKPRLEVVLNNLLSNAIKYQKPDNLNPSVIISCRYSVDILEISVADNGIGIPSDQQDKIFDMFYRGEKSKEGSGLGLYIVKNMIKKLEGEIQFNSVEGKGTKITISLPISKPIKRQMTA